MIEGNRWWSLDANVVEHVKWVLMLLGQSSNRIAYLIKDCQCNKKHKLVGKIVAPQDFPHGQGIIPWKLSLKPYKEPSEAEKEIVAVRTLEVLV